MYSNLVTVALGQELQSYLLHWSSGQELHSFRYISFVMLIVLVGAVGYNNFIWTQSAVQLVTEELWARNDILMVKITTGPLTYSLQREAIISESGTRTLWALYS